jgi:prevent-host-death family protein
MEKWQLQDAKNKFSEVVDNAFKFGPQCITRRGIETVVVLSVQEYKKLTSPTTGLVEFFRKSPLYGVDLDIERDKGHAREVDF